jgi:hypothetical protein
LFNTEEETGAEPRGATDLGPRTIIIDMEKEFRI